MFQKLARLEMWYICYFSVISCLLSFWFKGSTFKCDLGQACQNRWFLQAIVSHKIWRWAISFEKYAERNDFSPDSKMAIAASRSWTHWLAAMSAWYEPHREYVEWGEEDNAGNLALHIFNHTEERIMNLWCQLKLDLKWFQQYFTPPAPSHHPQSHLLLSWN